MSILKMGTITSNKSCNNKWFCVRGTDEWEGDREREVVIGLTEWGRGGWVG